MNVQVLSAGSGKENSSDPETPEKEGTAGGNLLTTSSFLNRWGKKKTASARTISQEGKGGTRACQSKSCGAQKTGKVRDAGYFS